MALPRAYIARRCSGQVRFKLPRRKHDAAFFGRAAEVLGRFPAVEALEVNPLTGSILVHHRATLEEVAQFAHEQNLFTLAQRPERVPPGRPSPRGEPRNALMLLVLLFGLIQLARGNVLGPASTLFWMAWQIAAQGSSTLAMLEGAADDGGSA